MRDESFDRDLDIIMRRKFLEFMRRKESEVESNLVEVKSINDFEKLINSNKPLLIDFWAPWCPPCLFMKPIFETLAKRYVNKIIFVKVNVDEVPDLAQRFGIFAVPTFIMLYRGEEVCRVEGAMPLRVFENWINNCLRRVGV